MNTVKKIVSVLLMFGGFGGIIRKDFIPAILFIILGTVLFPSISSKIKEKFKPWNNKAIRYGAYIFLFFLSGSFIKSQNKISSDNDSIFMSKKGASKYFDYNQKTQKNVTQLSDRFQQLRSTTLSKMKSTETYNDLVTGKVVSVEYLPLLTLINNGVRSIFTESNREETFTIQEPLIVTVEQLVKGKDKMKFAISCIQLATPNKGGIPIEIIEVLERYRKKYNVFGKPSRLYNSKTKQYEEIKKSYDMTGLFTLLNPENEIFLNKLFEANNSISSWFPYKSNQTLAYPFISNLKGYNQHVKRVYSNSPYILNVDFEITAKQLFNDYENNEVAADEKYKKKKLAVTGIIKQISKDAFNNPFVSLKVGFLKSVSCYFDDKHNKLISKLQKGQKITITGTCKGKSLGMLVVVKDCKVWSK